MKHLSRGTVAITILSIIPVVLLVSAESFRISLAGFASIAGILALTLLSCNIILSARLSIFDKFFNGLDKMYYAHYIIGCLVLIFALVHFNLLVVSSMQISSSAAFNFLLQADSIALLAGKASLGILFSAMIVVLFIKVKYQWFIITQRIMGAVIFFAGFHALFVPGSDIRRNTPLLLFLSVLGFTAAFFYIYRSLFHKKLNKSYEYTVDEIRRLGKITEVYLRPKQSKLSHYAGQFVFVSFNSTVVNNEPHPFTISSGSGESRLRFSIKNLGDYTKRLHKLRPGDTAIIEGPFGNFSST